MVISLPSLWLVVLPCCSALSQVFGASATSRRSAARGALPSPAAVPTSAVTARPHSRGSPPQPRSRPNSRASARQQDTHRAHRDAAQRRLQADMKHMLSSAGLGEGSVQVGPAVVRRLDAQEQARLAEDEAAMEAILGGGGEGNYDDDDNLNEDGGKHQVKRKRRAGQRGKAKLPAAAHSKSKRKPPDTPPTALSLEFSRM